MTEGELIFSMACAFSLVHNSALAQANVLAWVLGAGSGLAIAGFVATRMKHLAAGNHR